MSVTAKAGSFLSQNPEMPSSSALCIIGTQTLEAPSAVFLCEHYQAVTSEAEYGLRLWYSDMLINDPNTCSLFTMINGHLCDSF